MAADNNAIKNHIREQSGLDVERRKSNKWRGTRMPGKIYYLIG